MDKYDNQGFIRIFDDRLRASSLTDLSVRTSLAPDTRPRWMADHQDEIVSWSLELIFDSEASENGRTEFHKSTALCFSEIEFLRIRNSGIAPIPTSPIFDSGLPKERWISWESDEYGKYFGTGSRPCLWRSDSSELCAVVQSRRNGWERFKGAQAHYVVMDYEFNLEVFGVLNVEER